MKNYYYHNSMLAKIHKTLTLRTGLRFDIGVQIIGPADRV